MRIAVVHNDAREGVICRFGRPCPERYGRMSVKRVAEALAAGGHTVEIVEGDRSLLEALAAFMPPDGEGRPTGLVFNMAYGIQGDCRYTHVPSMLEMAGIPYTGSGPLGHALCLDKVVTKVLIEKAGIPTPAWAVAERPTHDVGLPFPLVVKPRHESTS